MSKYTLSNAGLMASAACSTVLLAPAQSTAEMDMQAMVYWGDATVIRWHVVGDYEGEDVILDVSTRAIAPVKDHVEISFDYTSAGNGGLTGTPGFTDAPTEMGAVRNGTAGCEAPSVSGRYEHSTIESIENGLGGQLAMTVRRDYPDGTVPSMCSGKPQPAVAKSTKTREDLLVPGIMMLVMGDEMATNDMYVAKDRKSIIVKRHGWTYSYTPTKVK